jgi:manganese/zinc-transporting P-type ATPase C
MNQIKIKSVADNRVRLKSPIFSDKKNLEIIEKNLRQYLFATRLNEKCQSLILYVDTKNIELFAFLEEVKRLFPKISLSAAKALEQESYCPSCTSCASCSLASTKKESWTRKLVTFSILSGYALYLFISENILGLSIAATPFSLVAGISLIAAIPLLKEAYVDIENKKITLHSFMSFTLLLAIFGGEATAAFEIIYILRGGMLLEEYIAEKSKKEIHKLIELDMKKVYILLDDVELEVELCDVKEGDIVVARSGEKIPVDGTILEGNAQIDEAIINGRSEPSLKKEGDEVFSNTYIEKGRVYIKVSATGANTYIARVMSKVEEALAHKSPSELAADKLASRLLKLGTLLTFGTLFATGSLVRAFSVMIVMSCPCATVLAASTAISAGMAKGAKENILIKGGEYLEKVSQSEVFCFDKTGTLTTGKPIIKEIYTKENISEKELLTYALLAEGKNTHPIAKAITSYAKSLDIEEKELPSCEVYPGLGVKVQSGDEVILVGNRKLLNNYKISVKSLQSKVQKCLDNAQSIVYIVREKELLGFLSFEHEVRSGTKQMLEELRKRGVKRLILLTGDEEKVVQSFSSQYGFDEVYSNLMPEQKAQKIQDFKQEYENVVMVGDGVNDTLAMSRSDVAISFACGGSEAAIEVSNIAITDSQPQDIIKLYDLSQKSLRVVEQNYWLGTSTNLIGVALASVGLLSPVAAGAIHIGHTVGIMTNSSKLAIS